MYSAFLLDIQELRSVLYRPKALDSLIAGFCNVN